MKIPQSMKDELGAWNNGSGIDLEGWVSFSGNYSLAVGYITLFWPDFVEFEGYILRQDFSLDSLRGFEAQAGSTRKSVEWVMNHLHLADLHATEEDLAVDKLLILGQTLKQIYEAKLASQFPHAPCMVEFYKPEDPDEILDYQLSFWQIDVS